ncbi:MAG: hypothetical protein AAFV33_04050, partial [Chloroflexota bacterium]
MRKNLILILISTILSLALVEVGLRITDPLGVDDSLTTLRRMSAAAVADERGWALPPGRHNFGHWQATVDDDRHRVLPDANDGDCTIAFVGDSVTFGYGVGDSAAWVNLLAAEFDATFINAAVPGYNYDQIEATFNTREADGYVYLMIVNDASTYVVLDFQFIEGAPPPPRGIRPFVQNRLLRATYSYVTYWRFQRSRPLRTVNVQVAPAEIDAASMQPFFEQLEPAITRDDVLVFGFDDTWLSQMTHEQFPQMVLIPRFTNPISVSDTHPDATGNIEIADAVRGPLTELVTRVC